MLRKGKVAGVATLELILEVAPGESKEAIETVLPALSADIQSTLVQLAAQYFRTTRPINPDLVRSALQPRIDNRLGGHKANVYVVSALISPM